MSHTGWVAHTYKLKPHWLLVSSSNHTDSEMYAKKANYVVYNQESEQCLMVKGGTNQT